MRLTQQRNKRNDHMTECIHVQRRLVDLESRSNISVIKFWTLAQIPRDQIQNPIQDRHLEEFFFETKKSHSDAHCVHYMCKLSSDHPSDKEKLGVVVMLEMVIVRHPPHRHPPHWTTTTPDIYHIMDKIGHPPHQTSTTPDIHHTMWGSRVVDVLF